MAHGHKLSEYIKLKPVRRKKKSVWDLFDMSRIDRQVVYGDGNYNRTSDEELSETRARSLASMG